MWGRREEGSLKWSRRGRLGLPLPPEDQDDFEDFEDFDGGDGDGEDHDEEEECVLWWWIFIHLRLISFFWIYFLPPSPARLTQLAMVGANSNASAKFTICLEIFLSGWIWKTWAVSSKKVFGILFNHHFENLGCVTQKVSFNTKIFEHLGCVILKVLFNTENLENLGCAVKKSIIQHWKFGKLGLCHPKKYYLTLKLWFDVVVSLNWIAEVVCCWFWKLTCAGQNTSRCRMNVHRYFFPTD